MRVLHNFILSSLLIFVFSYTVNAQTLSSPLIPAVEPTAKYFGFTIGLGQNYQTGKYYVNCKECEFEGGVGFGYTLGVYYANKLNDFLRWGVLLLYDDLSIQSKFQEYEKIEYQDALSGETEYVPGLFSNTGDIQYSNLSLIPYLDFGITQFFYFRLGFSGSINLSANTKHTKELLTKKAVLSNGTEVNLKLDGTKSNSLVIENDATKEVPSFQYGLMGTTGFSIPLSEKIDFNPNFMYRLPLNNASDYGDNFKLNSWRLMLEFEFRLE